MDKIMFNDKYGLTQAVLEGRKTQTRRIIHGLPSDVEGLEIIILMKSHREYDEQKFVLYCHTTCRLGKVLNIPYQVGEEVAIAQSYKEVHSNLQDLGRVAAQDYINRHFSEAGWSNKMFVSAEQMLHTIKITSVGFERLQDISEEDCLKEGVIKFSDNEYAVDGISIPYSRVGKGLYAQRIFRSAKEAFSVLIDKTSGKGTWESNPYVYVYGFELVK